MLRSTLSLNLPTSEAAKSRNAHVLPCVCIICESEKSYFPESASLLIFLQLMLFSQLLFHRPKVRNKSEIVYAECLSQASVA
jgi:hypothetical protein